MPRAPEHSVPRTRGMSSPDDESPPTDRQADAPQSVTGLLQAWGAGDGAALDALFPIVYDELRQRAGKMLTREGAGHTLQPTALVHEAYLRLVDQKRGRWEGPAPFFAIAARVMRRALVD